MQMDLEKKIKEHSILWVTLRGIIGMSAEWQGEAVGTMPLPTA